MLLTFAVVLPTHHMTIVVPFKNGAIPGYIASRRGLKGAVRDSSVSLASKCDLPVTASVDQCSCNCQNYIGFCYGWLSTATLDCITPIATLLPTLHRLKLNHCSASSLSFGALAPHKFFKLEILVFKTLKFPVVQGRVLRLSLMVARVLKHIILFIYITLHYYVILQLALYIYSASCEIP